MFTKIPRKWWGSIVTTGILALLLWSVNATLAQGPVNSQISYQGYLEESDTAVTGSRNMVFRLYSNDTCTTQVGSNIVKNGVNVNDGFFSVELDVTHAHFNGQGLWLEVEVAGNKIGCQKMLPTPYALSLRPGATINQSATGTAFRVDSAGQGIYVTSENDYAVYGYDSGSTQGQGYGGYFFSQSGVGLYGESTANESGQNPYAVGIYGKSANGVAGYFETSSIKSSIAGVRSESSTGYAVQGVSNTGMGVYGYSNDNYAVYGYDGGSTQAKGYGGYFKSTNGIGLYGESTAAIVGDNPNAPGVQGKSSNGYGVYGQSESTNGAGVYAKNSNSSGADLELDGSAGRIFSSQKSSSSDIYLHSEDDIILSLDDSNNTSTNDFQIYADSGGSPIFEISQTGNVSIGTGDAENPLHVRRTGTDGGGIATYDEVVAHFEQTSSGDHAAISIDSYTNKDPVLYLAENGSPKWDIRNDADDDRFELRRHFNASPNDVEFAVDSSGNAYADGSFNGGGADFAEMLPAHTGLEPGDVLAIGLDGQLTRTTEAYQTTVMGVYSTQPAFLGGAGMDADLSGKIPLAVVGIVPVKASTENGDISPGDLLTAASIPGHAMRCQGVELCFGRTIGKALEGLTQDTGTIQILVILQ